MSSELTDADYRDGCGETCRAERRCKCGQGYDERTRAHQVDGVLSSHRLPMAMSSRDDSLDLYTTVPANRATSVTCDSSAKPGSCTTFNVCCHFTEPEFNPTRTTGSSQTLVGTRNFRVSWIVAAASILSAVEILLSVVSSRSLEVSSIKLFQHRVWRC